MGDLNARKSVYSSGQIIGLQIEWAVLWGGIFSSVAE